MKNAILKLTKYLGKRVHKMTDSLTAELSENRVILNWIYCIAYLVLVWYCVRTNPDSHNTAIITTGGIVSTIFTVYILGSSWEKVQSIRSVGTTPIPPMPPIADEGDAPEDGEGED